MARLIPYIITFCFGFFVSMMLFNRRKPEGGWEAKYHELNARYRDLTRRLQEAGRGSDARVGRLRRTLVDVRGVLDRSEELTPDSAQTALTEITRALQETGSDGKGRSF